MAQGNLGPSERRKRLIFGLAALFLGLGMVVISAMNSVYSWVFLFMLFWVAGLGIIQAKEKT
jgi:NADH:ubiquinone oxidoreductase subunit 6 (subunit J)